MDVVASLDPALSFIEKLGFPVWAAVVLWAVVHVSKLVQLALARLQERDELLQKALTDHISKADTRIALIEQLVQRHDHSIEDLWRRLSVTPIIDQRMSGP